MIKLIVVNDVMGSEEQEPEEEAEYIREIIEKRIEKPVELVSCLPYFDPDEHSSIDILVFDYGGAMPGMDDTIHSIIREIDRWAQEHPSKIVIIWTWFSKLFYGDQFSELPSQLFCRYEEEKEHGYKDNERLWDVLKAYFRSYQ